MNKTTNRNIKKANPVETYQRETSCMLEKMKSQKKINLSKSFEESYEA